MRLSFNFVSLAYRVQYTRTCVHERIPNRQPHEDPLEEIARVGQVGEDCRACPARGEGNYKRAAQNVHRSRPPAD